MRIRISLLFAFVLLSGQFLFSSLFAADAINEAYDIVKQAFENDHGFMDSRADITMIHANKDGSEQIRRLRSYTIESDDQIRNISIVQFPPDLKRFARLAYANEDGVDDLWLLFPNQKRVKRVSHSNSASLFIGTEFAYEDWSVQQPEEPAQFTYKHLGTESCGEMEESRELTCYKIEKTPVSEYSGYLKLITWIDEKHLRTYRIDYYNRDGQFFKTLRFDGYKKYLNRHWRPSTLYMVNSISGANTRLVFDNYRFQNGFSSSAFQPGSLTRFQLIKRGLKDQMEDDGQYGLDDMLNKTGRVIKGIIDSITPE